MKEIDFKLKRPSEGFYPLYEEMGRELRPSGVFLKTGGDASLLCAQALGDSNPPWISSCQLTTRHQYSPPKRDQTVTQKTASEPGLSFILPTGGVFIRERWGASPPGVLWWTVPCLTGRKASMADSGG